MAARRFPRLRGIVNGAAHTQNSGPGEAHAAEQISFEVGDTGLTATDLQGVVEQLSAVPALGPVAADEVTYEPTEGTGLVSTDVQGIIDELITSVQTTLVELFDDLGETVEQASVGLQPRHRAGQIYMTNPAAGVDGNSAAPTKPTFVPVALPTVVSGGSGYDGLGVKVTVAGDTVVELALYSTNADGSVLTRLDDTVTTVTLDTPGLAFGTYEGPFTPPAPGQHFVGVTVVSGTTSQIEGYAYGLGTGQVGNMELLPVSSDGLGWSAGVRVADVATTLPATATAFESPDDQGTGFSAPLAFIRKA